MIFWPLWMLNNKITVSSQLHELLSCFIALESMILLIFTQFQIFEPTRMTEQVIDMLVNYSLNDLKCFIELVLMLHLKFFAEDFFISLISSGFHINFISISIFSGSPIKVIQLSDLHLFENTVLNFFHVSNFFHFFLFLFFWQNFIWFTALCTSIDARQTWRNCCDENSGNKFQTEAQESYEI